MGKGESNKRYYLKNKEKIKEKNKNYKQKPEALVRIKKEKEYRQEIYEKYKEDVELLFRGVKVMFI